MLPGQGLFCISLMIGDVEHLFMCLLATHNLIWRNVCSKPFAHVWIGLPLFSCWVLGVCILIPIRYIICKYFLPFLGFPFTLLLVSFDAHLKFCSPIHLFFLLLLLFSVPLVSRPRNYCQIQCHQPFPLYFLLRVLYFCIFCLGIRSLLN